MTTLRLLSVVCVMLLADLVYAQFILTLNCSEMDPYIGKQFEVRVTEIGSGQEVGRKTISMIESSSFSIELYTLLRNRSYNIDFYADVNENWSYDAPPVDHAWRRMVSDPTDHVDIDFTADTMYTDTGFPDVLQYSTYDAVWGGRWSNFTFGSTDSIQASIKVTCDSTFASVTTKGVFGNPDVVTFNFADTLPMNFDPVEDTLSFSPPAPWTGLIWVTNGEIHGDIALLGTGLQFTGTAGATQILCLYTVLTGGFPFANGFFYVRELDILSSTPMLIVDGEVFDVTCAGATDGAIAVMASGGNPEYTYIWSTGDTTALISGLAPGDYIVTVTDDQGCTQEATFTINEPAPITMSAAILDVSCFGVCDGALELMVTGGQPPYTYLWNIGSSTMVITGLCAGEYTVTVTDDAGCSVTASYTITEPDALLVSATTTDESCGFCNGSAIVSVSGGTPPYSFGGGNQIFVGLCAGTYSITVADDNGCIAESVVTITSADEITIDTVIITNATDGESNGAMEITASGGTPPFMYSINGTAYQSSPVFQGLPAGSYMVFVIDANGCKVSAVYDVQEISAIEDLRTSFRLYPNPVISRLNLEADTPLSVEFINVGGTVVKRMQASMSHQITIKDLLPGVYILCISDGKGKAYRKLIVQ